MRGVICCEYWWIWGMYFKDFILKMVLIKSYLFLGGFGNYSIVFGWYIVGECCIKMESGGCIMVF